MDILRQHNPFPLDVGPEDPVQVLPPALLSRSLEAVERVVDRIPTSDGDIVAWAIYATLVYLFDLNRSVLGRKLEGVVEK
jgi:hypothetical protein